MCCPTRTVWCAACRSSCARASGAALVPIDVGLQGAPSALAREPDAVLDLLAALGVGGRRERDRLELLP